MTNHLTYNSEFSVIGLDLELKDLPATIEVEGETLFVKSEFHVTLISPEKITEKTGQDMPNFYETIETEFKKFIVNQPVELSHFTNKFRLAAQAERKTVIALCEVFNLDAFFALINEKYNLSLEYPPLHVTLYTLQPDIGIFVINKADIENLTQPIEHPLGNIDLNNNLVYGD